MASITATTPHLGSVEVELDGVAAATHALYETCNEAERQRQIKHLGVISDVFESANHTRWDYLSLQLALTEIVRKYHRYTEDLRLGSLTYSGRKEEIDSLLKSWFMLANFGHARNTIADEKALLNDLRSSKKRKREFLALIKDSAIKKEADRIIREYKYTEFHFIIAAIRLYEELPAYSRLRRPLIDALKLSRGLVDYVPDRANLDKAYYLYRLIRKLAIVSLDSANSHAPFSFDLASTVLALPRSESRSDDRTIEHLLDHIIEWLTSELYTERHVLAMIRGYEIAGQANASGISAPDVIELALWEGLATPEVRFAPVHRQTVTVDKGHSSYGFQQGVQRLLNRILPHAAVIVDENASSGNRFIDFLVAPESRDSALGTVLWASAHNVEDLFRRQLRQRYEMVRKFADTSSKKLQEQGVDEAVIDRAFSDSFGHTLDAAAIDGDLCELVRAAIFSALRSVLKEGYGVTLPHGSGNDRAYGMWWKGGDGWGHRQMDAFWPKLNELRRQENDSGRLAELEMIDYATGKRAANLIIGCFDRILLTKTSRFSAEAVTDLDGVVMTCTPEAVILDIFETKSGGTTGAKRENEGVKDLREKVKPAAAANGASIRVSKVTGRGGRMRIKFVV